MTAPALVVLAHGSRDPRSARTVREIVAATKALRPDLKIEAAFLDHYAPTSTPSSTGWSPAATPRSSWSRCC